MKRFIYSFFLLASSSSAFSNIINSVVTGADMVGIEVTAEFSNGMQESLIWQSNINPVADPFGEHLAGGVSGQGWSLTQQGFTLGNFDPVQGVLGAWTLTNTSMYQLSSLTIDAIAGGFVFDALDGAEGTVGSGPGRFFQTGSTEPVVPVYGDIYNAPDLFGSLELYFADFGPNDSMQFLADTDQVAVNVPEPSSFGLMALGFLGLAFTRNRKFKR